MTDIQAAVGRVQLNRLGEFIYKRKEIYSFYKEQGLPLWPDGFCETAEPCHYRALLKTEAPKELVRNLGENGISAIAPIEDWEILENPMDFPRADALSKALTSIPIYPSLSIDDAEKISETVIKYTNP